MQKTKYFLVLLFAIGALYVAAQSAPVQAQPSAAPTAPKATILVNTYLDQWDDDANPASANTFCSLREALDKAFGSGNRGCGATPPNVNEFDIKFIGSGTFKLTLDGELPMVGGTGKIVNIDAWGVIIDGGYPNRFDGIFHVVGGTLNLKNITLQNGNRRGGGAIWMNGGTVTANKVTFKNNHAVVDPSSEQNGGAIEVQTGNLFVTESVFENNEALNGGGAVATEYGYFFKTKFIGNQAAHGGALYIPDPTTDPVQVVESEFKDNLAKRSPFDPTDSNYKPFSDPNGGGAISNNGHLQLIRTLIENNHASVTKGGGGMDNTGLAELEDCVFTKNRATSDDNYVKAFGGAIINGGVMHINRCSIHGNESQERERFSTIGLANCSPTTQLSPTTMHSISMAGW